jgi:hypothetical protein
MTNLWAMEPSPEKRDCEYAAAAERQAEERAELSKRWRAAWRPWFQGLASAVLTVGVPWLLGWRSWASGMLWFYVATLGGSALFASFVYARMHGWFHWQHNGYESMAGYVWRCTVCGKVPPRSD